MARQEPGMRQAQKLIPELRQAFWQDVKVPGRADGLNQSLEKALRTADFLEFAELFVEDALNREESCGCHFNEAFQTEEQEALRNDESCCHVSTWAFNGVGRKPTLHREPLKFENVKLTQRSYK